MILDVKTTKAPKPIGPYSQAVIAGGILYVSGQIPMKANGELIILEGIEEQARQVFENLKEIVAAAGVSLKQTLKLTVYLKDINHIQVVNVVMGEYFSEPFPARVCVEVSRLPKDVQIEADAVVLL